jgi:hypothetical protein
MSLVHPLPWWLAVAIVAAIGALAAVEYRRRPAAAMSPLKRGTLAACRAAALAALVLCLLRPVASAPPQDSRDGVVAVVVDRSLSMGLRDGGETRLARAKTLARSVLIPALSKSFTLEIYGAGDRLAPASLDALSADEQSSDLAGAIAAVRDRDRGERLKGIVLLSDGADTGQLPTDRLEESIGRRAGSAPVFAVGIGPTAPVRDREVAGLIAGEQRLEETTIDLRASLVTSGFGRTPFTVRVLANGREVESRRVTPVADGAPLDEVFTVAPDPAVPTVYTVEIQADPGEAAAENNTRSVLVSPAGRRRRVLMIEGAPAFEHSFIRRAWARDPGIEIDVAGRKGRNVDGRDTYFVQAPMARAAALARGFPGRREDLYAYDAVALANVEADLLTREQLTMIAEFVSKRGGGLLVVGSRSVAARGLGDTPVEAALPLDSSDRRGDQPRPAHVNSPSPVDKLVLTPEGEQHPATRIGESLADTRRLWAALPPLAFTSPVGGLRKGATALAVASAPTGIVYPVIAVQRYGRGRSMIFSGEASWRWKMLLPATDRSFELFWRHAVRWLAGASPDPVSVAIDDAAAIGDDTTMEIEVRDAAFVPSGDAAVTATVTRSDTEREPVNVRQTGTPGRYAADLRFEKSGLYRITVEAERQGVRLGTAERWVYAGGVDREFSNPVVNEGWLRRLARDTGGRYVRPADVSSIPGWLRESASTLAAPGRRELWHEPWVYALIVGLLAAEWILRRRWGLR